MADRTARETFLQLIAAIERRKNDLTDYAKKNVIEFTLSESKTDFLSGEEHLAIDLLVNNLHEFNFPLTTEIFEAVSKVGQMVQYPPDRLLVLQDLVM